jgi:hypothetical protein
MLRSSRIRSYLVVSFASVILLCAFSLQVVQGADLSVVVNPSTGIDSPSCYSDPPCKTIAYAIHSRKASSVYLTAGYFNESNVIINGSSPFVSITSLNGSSSTVFDCKRRSSTGQALSIFNTAVSISGITFQNCANFDGLSGIGGAVSAIGSSVTVNDCKFFNNTARIGGAIGVKLSSLVVSSCDFENNTATCPNAAFTTTACSAWGGAIGTEESPSVSIIGNRFNVNSVNLVLNNVTSATSKAVGGGGCISVMHKGNVSESRVRIDGNSLESCSVQMIGFNDRRFRGIQFGNTYGGAVSLYYGLEAVDSLVVQNARYAFVNNLCRSSGIASSVGVGGNAYGGCLSVHVGAWNVNTQGESGVGSLTLSMETNISGNTITNCSAQRTRITAGNSLGANVYGGGISVAVGAYSYGSGDSISTVSGSTTVSNTSYTISNNTLTNCNAASSVSGGFFGGANVYGGGISVAVGAYSYSGSSSILGSTTVRYTSYTISSNTLTNCNAASSASGGDSYGANVYGGGISVAVGAYSYSDSGSSSVGSSNSTVSGDTTVSDSSYTISNNTLTGCSATSSLSASGSYVGANVYGGGISVAVGAYSFSSSFIRGSSKSSSSSSVSGSTTVSNTSYIISNNTLMNCNATMSGRYYASVGVNVYGGGISVAVGAYSYSYSSSSVTDSYSKISSSNCTVSGDTTVSDSSYTISSNTLTNCNASSASGTSASSVGANVYGGGISLAVGVYSDSFSGSNSDSSSTVSGSTTVSDSSYTISNNTLTNCNATSSARFGSYGANVYGGGISVAVGVYSHTTSSINSDSSSTVSGDTMVSNTSYTISSNTLTNCNATSSARGGRSHGMNVYGGGISVAVGAYSCSLSSSNSDSSSTVLGSTKVSDSSYTISNNTLTGCSATSYVSGSGSSFGANVYGGGISVAVAAYSYSGDISTVSGDTMVSNTSYTISSNTLTNCNASSVSGTSSVGASVYGGGISVAVGAYSYCVVIFSSDSISTVSGDTTVSNTSYTILSNSLTGCSVLSEASSTSNGASAYGGAFSLVHNASSFPFNSDQSVARAINASFLRVHYCSFFQSKSIFSSTSCASGAGNVAGGAVFALVPSLAVEFFASVFSNATASTTCAAPSYSTYSLGGGISIFHAGNVNVTSTNFTGCFAQGISQSNNVFVSGGGLHIQASDSFLFQNGLMTNCSVLHAFSTFLQSGGGALSTQNVSLVQISDSIFRDNSDSSFTGSIFLQQLKDDCGMNVTMDRSLVLVQPSSTPALNISCGSNCSQSQRQRINIRFQKFNISAYSEPRTKKYDSSAMISLPASSSIDSDRNSSLNCLFNLTNYAAILITNTGAAFLTFVCAPCARPFEIAQTSRTLELSNFQNVTNLGQRLCQPTASSDLQQCPFGVPFCSTTLNISVGFWASFSANGTVGNAIRCPQNYCGCRNVPDYNHSSCLLEPPFAPEFQADMRITDNLCKGNRVGVLCGGCKLGFTQSLDGYSCISNEECSKNLGWTWAVTIIGYFIFSIYIVYSTRAETPADTLVETPAHTPAETQVSDSLISCVLFYGQMSSFAIVPPTSATSSETQHSSVSSWSARVSQFSSISSLYSQTCFGPNMSAYAMTAAELCGPAIVLFFSLAFALFMKLRHKNPEKKSFSILATLSVVVLFIFSSVATVVFKLVTCATITIDDTTEDVVFIDGSVKCYNGNRSWLLAVAVFLCLFPFVYAAALRHKEKYLSDSVQRALCSAFKKEGIYWGVVTSIFRLVMSIVFATTRDFPSTAALIQSFLCVAVLILLTYQKPYRDDKYTYNFDILCYAILIFQFGFAVLVSVSESLGVSTSESNLYFATLRNSAAAIAYLRYVSRCLLLSSLHYFIFVSRCAFGSYIVFIFGITLWLILHRTSIYENMLFCYDTIYDKVSFCYRSLKGYGKACFDNHCFVCCYRFKERFFCCKCRRPSAHDGSVSSDESSEVAADASQRSMHGATSDLL